MPLTIRLGHAYRSDAKTSSDDELAQVVRILCGEADLQPRTPRETKAVSDAETAIGITSPVIYAFVGCLHPDLGRIGLVISPECLDGRLQGVTKCDSGGLAGRIGSFSYVQEDEKKDALVALSINEDPEWHSVFDDEMGRSYQSTLAYVTGETPDYASWTDIRVRCISKPPPHGGPPDRRLWTWEVRLSAPPEAHHYEALILSHEALKQLESLRLRGREVPSDVTVLFGTISATGVHYFSGEEVFQLLKGPGP